MPEDKKEWTTGGDDNRLCGQNEEDERTRMRGQG